MATEETKKQVLGTLKNYDFLKEVNYKIEHGRGNRRDKRAIDVLHKPQKCDSFETYETEKANTMVVKLLVEIKKKKMLMDENFQTTPIKRLMNRTLLMKFNLLQHHGC